MAAVRVAETLRRAVSDLNPPPPVAGVKRRASAMDEDEAADEAEAADEEADGAEGGPGTDLTVSIINTRSAIPRKIFRVPARPAAAAADAGGGSAPDAEAASAAGDNSAGAAMPVDQPAAGAGDSSVLPAAAVEDAAVMDN